MSDSNEQSEEHAETDENDDSFAEVDADGKFSFTRVVPDEALMQNKNIPEHKKKHAEATTAKTEFEKVSANWIDHK